MAWSRTGISVARVWASAVANSVTSCPSSTRALVRCATMRSVPPYKLGGTASYSGAICAIFIRCHQSSRPRHDDFRIEPDHLLRQGREAIEEAVSVTVFDADVAPLEVTELTQCGAKCLDAVDLADAAFRTPIS